MLRDEPIDIEKEVAEYAAKLRAMGEGEGVFLAFERGSDGTLVAVYESRGGIDGDDRDLTKDVTASSEFIRCTFSFEGIGFTVKYELKLVGKHSAEGDSVTNLFGDVETEPVKLERVR